MAAQLQMPEAVTPAQLDQALRLLGFAPHQVRKLIIDGDSGAGVPGDLEVTAVVNRQVVTRLYSVGGGPVQIVQTWAAEGADDE